MQIRWKAAYAALAAEFKGPHFHSQIDYAIRNFVYDPANENTNVMINRFDTLVRNWTESHPTKTPPHPSYLR